jgi:hypothetical protein
MKVIATNIFDFTTWYKFGIKSVPRSFIIDLEDVNLTGEELLRRTGFFEEEYEVFFIEVKEEVISKEEEIIDVSLYDSIYIVPISETASLLLHKKIPDFILFAPLDDDTYKKLMSARNRALAIQGAKRLLESFHVEWRPEYDDLQSSFLNSLSKYRSDLNADQDTVLDQVLFYERSKPFPLTDHGYLFDLGSVAKSRFGIQDEEIRNKESLKEHDPYKYELIEQIISLSKFLSKREIQAVWSEFIKYYEATPQLHALNEETILSAELKAVNNLLAIGLYFKFRDMIRNTMNLEDGPFVDYIKKSLAKAPEEAKIALLLNGLFFGGLKFKELHYSILPLEISKIKYQIQTEQSKIPYSSDESPSNEVPENQKEPHLLEENEKNPTVYTCEDLWQLLLPTLQKYHRNKQKKIKEIFDNVMKIDPNTSSARNQTASFIRKLRDESNNKRVKKEESKISEDIVIEIEDQLNRIMTSDDYAVSSASENKS